MGYSESLRGSADWLCKIQRKNDGGWGLNPGQVSSLVNTAEALFVLSKATCQDDVVLRGLSFIERFTFEHVQTRGPRTRYVAFPLLVVGHCFPAWNVEFRQRLIEWLIDARNTDGGWGVEARDNSSDLFSTYVAMTALGACKIDFDSTATARWILSRASSRGWTLRDRATAGENPPLSYVATAYAILALAAARELHHEAVQRGKEILLQIDHWGHEDETISGTVWRHCTYTHVLQALAVLGVDPFSPTIANGVRHISTLASPEVGWEETSQDKTQTVRAQYWAVAALSALSLSIDPAIHIPRIDAERTQDTLREPEFFKFFIHSPWATVLPARLYKYVVWGLLVASAYLALTPFTLPPIIPDDILGISLAALAWWLITKRPKAFGKLRRWGNRLVVVLGVINLLLGPSVRQLSSGIRELLGRFIS